MEARVKGAMNPDLYTAIQHLHKAIAAGGVGPRAGAGGHGAAPPLTRVPLGS